jgi:signal transduction histidine kinase
VEELDLPELLRETIALMGLPEGVVMTAFALNAPSALGDARQIRRVFINLIKNAWEALEGFDNPKIVVAVQLANEPDLVAVEVYDNGPGIPPEMIDKIWVSFFTTKGERGGTGLGLSACLKIVDQAGGKIWVDSQVGEGTTFTVLLPAATKES